MMVYQSHGVKLGCAVAREQRRVGLVRSIVYRIGAGITNRVQILGVGVRVVIIGAGLAGLAAAHYLVDAGVDVTVLERQPGPGLETSFGNGALLHPSVVAPWNSPGITRLLLSQLCQSQPALRIRASALPSLFGWGLRFLRDSTADKFFANTLKNLRLALYSLDLMRAFRQMPNFHFGSYTRGSLQIFRSETAAERAQTWVEALVPHGLTYRCLQRDDVIQLEPALEQIASSIAAATHFPGDEGGDAYQFCDAMDRSLRERGAKLFYNVTCQRFLLESGCISGVVDDRDRSFHADVYVLAAGSYSPALARTARVRLPVRPVKGYSITLPRGNRSSAPQIPVGDPALHIAVVPLGRDRIRVAGTAEFASYDARIDPSRVANLMNMLRRLYPAFALTVPPGEIQPWTGFRPMSPDGVPIIGTTPVKNLFLNTGHGHFGWTVAAGSGKTVADIITQARPAIDPLPYSLSRFA